MALLPTPMDSESIEEPGTLASGVIRRHALTAVVLVLTAAFFGAPWSFEEKAHAVLHGICGQTPSHTLTFQGMALPLDTRCVGIFGGLLVTFLLLALFGRHRAAGLPSIGAGILLLVFLGAMAVDGVNSLLTDLERWHPYTPSNDHRLLTGWMTGIGLGTLICMIIGMTLWRRPKSSSRVLPSWWWVVLLLLPCLPAWLLLRTGSRIVYYPGSVLLIVAAVVAFAALSICATVMLRNRDNSYASFREVVPVAALGVVVAVAILLALSGGRFWLERTFGLSAPA
jgi:uncharacterized membrane protein